MHLSPRVVRGGLGGAGPSEERAATSNSSWGPVSYRLMGVAARDGRVVQLPSPAPEKSRWGALFAPHLGFSGLVD